MKYVLEYSTRKGSTYEETLKNYEAVLRAFDKWAPPAGLTIHAFVQKLEADGGYVVAETDDPTVLTHWVIQFLSWNDVRVIPVIDIGDAVPLYSSGLAWARGADGG